MLRNWLDFSDRVLNGHKLTRDDARAILSSPDTDILEILAAAYRVRRHFHGVRMSLNFLINAKSGLCGEDCAYCSQSRVST
ncbi:MAG TPA: biotin synthase BioB, partial [Thermogutta sp.]|nr:biotin synthase BioB [Thermogutta sp.]